MGSNPISHPRSLDGREARRLPAKQSYAGSNPVRVSKFAPVHVPESTARGMADTHGSNPCGFGRVGSSPTLRTNAVVAEMD